ncbi:hypothetical protein HYR99_32665 [Candidatus Poribacteria bacterium]|nr:hypothetical protein [Candidatus Poribacteria bacterium]
MDIAHQNPFTRLGAVPTLRADVTKGSEEIAMVDERLEFKCTTMLNQGTDNPIVNRIGLQFFDILNSVDLSKPKKDEIEVYLFECMKDLIRAEELKKAYAELEEQAIQKIVSKEGVQFQHLGFSYDDPTEALKRYFDDFLIRCVIAIRKIIKIAEIISNKKLEGPGQLKQYLNTLFADSTPEMKMIKDDSKWVMELFDLRRQVEHEVLIINPFDLTISPNGRGSISLPRVISSSGFPSGGALIGEYLEVTLENCFTFCEDMMAILLNTCMIKGVQIVQIPEELRPQHQGFKYVLDLDDEYKRALLRSIKEAKSVS